jgi:hypothetical protein
VKVGVRINENKGVSHRVSSRIEEKTMKGGGIVDEGGVNIATATIQSLSKTQRHFDRESGRA